MEGAACAVLVVESLATAAARTRSRSCAGSSPSSTRRSCGDRWRWCCRTWCKAAPTTCPSPASSSLAAGVSRPVKDLHRGLLQTLHEIARRTARTPRRPRPPAPRARRRTAGDQHRYRRRQALHGPVQELRKPRQEEVPEGGIIGVGGAETEAGIHHQPLARDTSAAGHVLQERDDVVRAFVDKSCEVGIDVFRVPGAWEEEGSKILAKYGVEFQNRTVSIDEAARIAVKRGR